MDLTQSELQHFVCFLNFLHNLHVYKFLQRLVLYMKNDSPQPLLVCGISAKKVFLT